MSNEQDANIDLTCPVCGAQMEVQYVGQQADKRAVCPACGAAMDLPDSFKRTRTKRTTRRGLFGSTTVEEVIDEKRSDFPSTPPIPQSGSPPKYRATPASPLPNVQHVAIPVQAQTSGSGCGVLILVIIGLVVTLGIGLAVFAATGEFDTVTDFFDENFGDTFSNARTINQYAPLEGQAQIEEIALSPDGTILAAALGDGFVTLWDVTTHDEMATFNAYERETSNITFSPDGTQFVTYGDNSMARVWDTATQSRRSETRLPSSVQTMAFAPQSGRLIVLHTDRTIRIWNIATWQTDNSIEFDGSVNDFAISQDEIWLITIMNRNTILVWNLAANRVDKSIFVGENLEGHLALSPDSKWLAVPVSDEIWLYDTDKWQVERKLESDETAFSVEDILFSPTGRYLAAGDFFDKPHIWEVDNGRLRVKMEDVNTAELLLFTLDGEQLITAGGPFSVSGRGSPGNVIRIWDVFEGDKADSARVEPEAEVESEAEPAG